MSFVEMTLVAFGAILAYEVVTALVVYTLRDRIRLGLNLYLGNNKNQQADLSMMAPKEALDEQAKFLLDQLESHKRLVAGKLTEVSGSMRNTMREIDKQIAENSSSIKKLKTTKANSSAVKKLAAAQLPKSNKTTRITKTGRKPKSSRKGR